MVRIEESEDTTESAACEIAIVGGGCSGLLVAAQLLRNGFQGRIAVFEVRSRLGSGVAYATTQNRHLLNVPAGKMSAFPDQPSHFTEWLQSKGLSGAQNLFAPRMVYGEYLEDVLKTELRTSQNSKFSHIQAEVTDIGTTSRGVVLTLGDQSTIAAEKVVLALGNPASAVENIPNAEMGEHWRVSPWLGDALRIRFSGERFLLLGMGLTATDSVLALQDQGATCQVYTLSRRGIPPQVHDLGCPPCPPPAFGDVRNIRLMFRQMRAEIRDLGTADRSWRAAIDALRPATNQIWQDLPLAERQRFLRHLKPYWEAYRHRMAPQVRGWLDEYRAQGKLHSIAGRVRETSFQGDAIQVRISLRGGGERLLEVDRVINCTGIQEDYRNSPRGLIRRLVGKGIASPNDLGIGFRTDVHGALIDSRGSHSASLFTLGPPRRGELFETTAVPEIRVQATALARHLCGANRGSA
jgi:uncharacterized NAD(P)/FAD-binding protein YdhS